jgi:hypothetical protein
MLFDFDKPKRKEQSTKCVLSGLLVPLMQIRSKRYVGEVWSIDKAHKHLSNKFVFHESVNQNRRNNSNL